MLGGKSNVFYYFYFMPGSTWRNIFKDSCQQTLSSSFSSECSDFSLPVPCIPNRGRPFSPSILSTACLPHHHRPSPICLSALRPQSWGCTLSLPPSLSLPASLSLMRRDRYGRGGRGGTCLSKPAVENEGSDEGGMLCILNAQTPVRGGGGFGVGIYQ